MDYGGKSWRRPATRSSRPGPRGAKTHLGPPRPPRNQPQLDRNQLNPLPACLPLIKAAVNAGQRVFADSPLYEVIKDQIGQYLIVCRSNNHCIGLHGMAGTQYEHRLNARRFFTA